LVPLKYTVSMNSFFCPDYLIPYNIGEQVFFKFNRIYIVMSYIIAAPSYNRSEICNAKTLAMLSKNEIPKDIIHVYVANEEEYDKYMRVLNPDLYGVIAVGIIGLVPQRQYIMEQFPTGTHIVFIDDDIVSVDLSLASKFKDESLEHFFTQAFTITEITMHSYGGSTRYSTHTSAAHLKRSVNF